MSIESESVMKSEPSSRVMQGLKATGGCLGDTCDGFKKFLLRGNVVDLAVAVVVGTSFTALVNALVADWITPLIGAIFNGGDFSDLYFTVNGSIFNYGHFINALITFIMVCFIVYFLVVLPMNILMKKVYPEVAITRSCPECLMADLPCEATRCKYCCAQFSKKSMEEALEEEEQAVTTAAQDKMLSDAVAKESKANPPIIVV